MLQAYLPDALAAMIRLTTGPQPAAPRRRRIKVRLVKGANLPMEHVDAAMHDWPLATYGTKQDSDTNYKRVLNFSLTPTGSALRIGVAGHNLFDIAYAWLLAEQRGVAPRRHRIRDAARHGPGSGRGRHDATSAICCSTCRSSTRPSSTSRSPT